MNAIPSADYRGPSASEAEPQAETEETFVNTFTSELTGICDFHKAIQPWETGGGIYRNVASGVTRRSRSVAARSCEMRCVRRVEGFHPELESETFLDFEFAEEPEIQVRSAGTLESIEAYGSEPGGGHGHKGGRIIERCAHTDAAEFLDLGFDLIGPLCAAWGVQ